MNNINTHNEFTNELLNEKIQHLKKELDDENLTSERAIIYLRAYNYDPSLVIRKHQRAEQLADKARTDYILSKTKGYSLPLDYRFYATFPTPKEGFEYAKQIGVASADLFVEVFMKEFPVYDSLSDYHYYNSGSC